jgi:hypothetical protein
MKYICLHLWEQALLCPCRPLIPNNNNDDDDDNNNNNSILYYLCAEPTATRPIPDTAQCR